ncbi:MAG: tRNA 2-selenouridine(34) synthase MnmH [Spirochaetes bacterium]|nr:tRNA 2-selenouridine(34) synthase MnmH [Spirochaetota bacterium]
MKDIYYEESLNLRNPVYIDVRSPLEFEEDHIPGALNLPIFDNEERKEVGTLYKMVGRDQAVLRGTEIGGKRIGNIINKISELKGCDIVIYCARGGMRSASVSSLLSALGIETYRIIDGYKSYRRYVNSNLSNLKIKPAIYMLQGLTGSGKTDILKELNFSVDLEGMAGHRSSVFGGIGLRQNSQKYFEGQLFWKLTDLNNNPYILFEAESRKVGNLHIPDNIFSQMRAGDFILIKTPLERRIDIIKKEYSSFRIEEIISIVNSIRGKLGNAKSNALIELIENSRIDEFIEILLKEYYDPLYMHSIKKLNYIAEIENRNTKDAAEEVVLCIDKHYKKLQSGNNFQLKYV